jgi:hypothetical protein
MPPGMPELQWNAKAVTKPNTIQPRLPTILLPEFLWNVKPAIQLPHGNLRRLSTALPDSN